MQVDMKSHETAFFTHSSESKCILPRRMARLKFHGFILNCPPQLQINVMITLSIWRECKMVMDINL